MRSAISHPPCLGLSLTHRVGLGQADTLPRGPWLPGDRTEAPSVSWGCFPPAQVHRSPTTGYARRETGEFPASDRRPSQEAKGGERGPRVNSAGAEAELRTIRCWLDVRRPGRNGVQRRASPAAQSSSCSCSCSCSCSLLPNREREQEQEIKRPAQPARCADTVHGTSCFSPRLRTVNALSTSFHSEVLRLRLLCRVQFLA